MTDVKLNRPSWLDRPWRGLMAVAVGVVSVALLLPAAAGAQISPDEYANRRAALAERAEDGIVLAMGAAAPQEDYLPFYQNSTFRYLTGFLEPDAALFLQVEDGAVVGETLFVLPRDPAEEVWDGFRAGAEGAEAVTGVPARSVEDMESVLDSLVTAGWSRVSLTVDIPPPGSIADAAAQRIDQLLSSMEGVRVASVAAPLRELRGVKTEAEMELIQKAVDITVQAQKEIMEAAVPGMNEFELQALLEYTFRRYGAERPAFASIVGSGPNSTTLHYNDNDRFMEAGDLVVVDIGAAYDGYAADVTRTFPVNGRFTEAQREIYALVREAQETVASMAGPGVTQVDLQRTAVEVLSRGLAELGLIESPSATYVDHGGQQLPQYFLYYMHGLGHGIGLDVHDPWPMTLEPGVPFTIEPGVYVRENLLDDVVPDTPANAAFRDAVAPAFQRYAGTGVRIEDDYVVTESGVRHLSPAPREMDEIEALMARPADGPEARNEEWVEWYRSLREARAVPE